MRLIVPSMRTRGEAGLRREVQRQKREKGIHVFMNSL